MHLPKMFRIIGVVFLITFNVSSFPVHAEENTFSADRDFKFMEIQRDLRENPKGPRSRENLFAMGEYYFQGNSTALAADCFRRFDPVNCKKLEDFVAMVYLVRCADLSGDIRTAAFLKKELEDKLCASSFFASFNNQRVLSWNSPLGNRFDFHEYVDRMEISINGSQFYTISLS